MQKNFLLIRVTARLVYTVDAEFLTTELSGQTISEIILQRRISGKSVCSNPDLWSTKYTNDSFLDIHILWVENYEIHYRQIRMINVDEINTADVIKKKLIDVLTKYTDIEKKVFITIDSGANLLNAVKDFDSLRCLCNRINTSINDGLKNALANNSYLNDLNESVSNHIE
ncbi:MAG: hypothetical protein MHMPM18_001917 [Marteilia pararefringens]